ncbi:MAG: hypothetical protein NTW29_14220 [Bacteroidetes bacterium]|nr:hypothetical protein [Bacteroidota bacterium]
MKRVKEIALVICGLVIGIALSVLFRKSAASENLSLTANPGSAKKLEQKVAAQEKQVHLLIENMNQKNILLVEEIQSLKDELSATRINSRKLQIITHDLATKKTAATDTALRLADCDTLKEKVVLLNNTIQAEESLCDSIISSQQQQLLLKDSTIQLHHVLYNGLKQSFTESIAQQQVLLDQNSFYKKQLRKQKFKSKLISGLAIIAAGVTTHYLLK